MSHADQTIPVLSYSKSRRRFRVWRRSIYVIVAVLTIAVYVGMWLRMANTNFGAEMVSGGVFFHDRSPPHLGRGLVVRIAFEPAFRVDLWIRPNHWNGLGPLDAT